MTDFNSTITVGTEGIDNFVKGLKQIDSEIKIIEAELRKIGVPEGKIKKQAITFRNQMIASTKKIAAERKSSDEKIYNQEKALSNKQFKKLKSQSKALHQTKVKVKKVEHELFLQQIKEQGKAERKQIKKNNALRDSGTSKGGKQSVTKSVFKGNIASKAVGGVFNALSSVAQQTIDGFIEVEKGLISLSNQTDLTGTDLTNLNGDIIGLTETFDVDYNEALQANITLMKEFGLSHDQAQDSIEQGFLNGANVNGDFLTQVREYSTQFREAGLGAEDLVNIIQIANRKGVFNDKLADSIKEAGLAIRGMTKTTKIALEPLGKLRNEQIKIAIQAGKSFEAMQLVAKGMDEVSLSAAQTQAIIADVFKGAGEDAGRALLDVLKEYDTELNNVFSATNIYRKEQEKLLEANKELGRVQSELSKDLGAFWTNMKTLGVESLTSLIKQMGVFAKWLGFIKSEVDTVNNAFEEQTLSINKWVGVLNSSSGSVNGKTKALKELNKLLKLTGDDVLTLTNYEKNLEKQLDKSTLSLTKQKDVATASAEDNDFIRQLKEAEQAVDDWNESVQEFIAQGLDPNKSPLQTLGGFIEQGFAPTWDVQIRSSQTLLEESEKKLSRLKLKNQARYNRLFKKTITEKSEELKLTKEISKFSKNELNNLRLKLTVKQANNSATQKELDLLKEINAELLKYEKETPQINHDGGSSADKRKRKNRERVGSYDDIIAAIEADLDDSLTDNEIQSAKILKQELDDVAGAYIKILGSLEQSKKAQIELKRELLASKKGFEDVVPVFDELKRQFIKSFTDGNLGEQLTQSATFDKLPEDLKKKFKSLNFTDTATGLDLFKLFETESLSGEEADAIFKKVTNIGNTLRENIDALAKEGITSPLFEEILSREENTDRLEKEIETNAKLIEDSGVEGAKKTREIEDSVLEYQEKIAKKRVELEKQIGKTVADLFVKNGHLLSALGESDLTTAVLSKTSQFKLLNDAAEEAIEKTKQLLLSTKGDEKLSEKYTQILRDQTDTLVTEKRLQDRELEDLGVEFAKTELAQFKKRFTNQKDELENNLREQTMDVRDAEAERDADRKRFNKRAKRDDRDFNDAEIGVMLAHTENIIGLEDKRHDTEKTLRVGAYIAALGDIKLRHGDIDILLKKFNLDERQLVFDHNKKLVGIIEKGAIEQKDGKKKAFLTSDEIGDLVDETVAAFQDVFSAYLSYQDSIGEAAISAIQTQLDFINSEISESTSSLNSLQDDLEGKREGRREAVLRGIEVEKDKNESLVDKKIEQERRLEEEEKKQSERRKEAAISQALINAAVAVTGTWAGYASLGFAGIVAAGIQTATILASTGFEIATIQNQTFADGGMLEGNSHANGGIPFTIDGVSGFEAEGGEAIINKRSTSMYKPLLSAINEAGGGKKFQQGAVLGANFESMNDVTGGFRRSDLMEILNKEIFVSVTDIQNTTQRQASVTERSSI